MAGPKGLTPSASLHARQTFEVKASGQAARDYDFISARPPAKTTNIIESIGHLIKSCLGAGMVAIHEAYKVCGLWTAFFLNIFLGMAVAYGMYILTNSAQRLYGRTQVAAMSFPDVSEAAAAISPWPRLRKHSRKFRYIVDFILIVDLFGSCCVYQVVIARTIKQLVEGTDSITDGGNPPIRVYIVALLLPCILLCMITTLKYLAPFSILADIFIIMVAIATVYYGSKSVKQSPNEFPIFKSVAGLFEFLGVCVFSVEGVGATLPIENNMTNPRKMPIVIFGGMSFVVAIVMIIGFFGYWGFGEDSKSPITVNFPFEPFPICLKAMMALMVYVTFALNFWIPFNLIWVYVRGRHNPEKFWIWERVYRAVLVTLVTMIAITFPNVSKFMGLLGSFCLSNMGFIIPATVQLILDWTDPGLGLLCWRFWRALIIIAFGVTLGVVGTYSNAKELILEVFYNN